MAKMPRVESIVLPILRGALSSDVKCGTWIEDIDYRHFPMVNVRRLGGVRNVWHPTLLSMPIIEMTAYGTETLAATETLYDDALEALYDAVRRQVVTPAGYLSSIFETMGATQFSSPFMDSWRVQGLIKFGTRPPR